MPKGNGSGRVRRAAVALMVGVLAVPALEHYRETYGEPYDESEDSTSWAKGEDTVVRVHAPDPDSGDVAVDSVWSRP